MSLDIKTGLLFLRHAETDMAGTFCGHSDPPLNDRGESQISDLLARIGSEIFDAIYSSDLRRAAETAEALAEKYAVPVTTTPCLREIYFGDWEGLTWAEIEQRDAAYARRWVEEFPALSAPGGETYVAFEQRVLNQVQDLLRLAERKRIVVVTHGGVMRVVLQKSLGNTAQQAWELTKSYCCHFDFTRQASSRSIELFGCFIAANGGIEPNLHPESEGGLEW